LPCGYYGYGIYAGKVLTKATDCSFFYWHRTLAGLYFKSILEERKDVDSILASIYMIARRMGRERYNILLQLFMKALDDSCVLFNSARHYSPAALVDTYRRELLNELESVCLIQLCHDIAIAKSLGV